jgi:predicted TPR repeat methyltransferase
MVDEAIVEYREAVRLEPGMADAWYDLGMMHRANKDNAAAIEAFQRYLALTGGKDPAAEARARDELEALGAPSEASPPPDKKKPKGRR